ncbi:MAG TPA: C2H2-type zinc finger protein [Candidatus Limnocylindrales bacterium]|nr:C2H2-type zinc finger protein [Candidatus Limnocylindrales bacterium]
MAKPKKTQPGPIHSRESDSTVHEEPVRTLQPSRLKCEICGKTFKTHSEVDRHMESIHGEPERTHTGAHTGHRVE